jgi:hypothetical protein
MMVKQMFPSTERILVFACIGGDRVFGDVGDDDLPGLEMAVLLKAADATGKTLGTAECDVTPNGRLVALKPGVKDLTPDAAFVMVE